MYEMVVTRRKHEITREYSISEYPKNNEYRITVRYIPGGKFLIIFIIT